MLNMKFVSGWYKYSSMVVSYSHLYPLSYAIESIHLYISNCMNYFPEFCNFTSLKKNYFKKYLMFFYRIFFQINTPKFIIIIIIHIHILLLGIQNIRTIGNVQFNFFPRIRSIRHTNIKIFFIVFLNFFPNLII